ncbi:MAG: hypothetical protein A2075_07620 [Geobacteraceae bacterium GWC2_58_44]|nr:MAG: hypothetical protein A2075_07620 [Geobacteraceae bacterium GWC2_58_44]
MQSAHLRLYEITQSVKGDPLGNALMDEVLTTCFDHALGNRGALERLIAAMNRFNSYLSGYAPPVSLGLFRGTPEEISAWAEQLTSQILSNNEQ